MPARGAGGAPDLAAAALWAGSRRPGTSAESYLTESIRQPTAFAAPGFESPTMPELGPSEDAILGSPAMPDLGLSDDEIHAVVAYLLADTESRS